MSLPTASIHGLEIFSTGRWNGDFYSERDLDEMVDAFDKVGFEPVVKAGHEALQEDEETARQVFGAPALGYVKRLYRRGPKLLADIGNVPRRFAELIKSGAYKQVSAEVYWSWKDGSGRVFPRVLKAVAFLGARIPAITDLRAVESLYGENNVKVATFRLNGGNLMNTENHGRVPEAEIRRAWRQYRCDNDAESNEIVERDVTAFMARSGERDRSKAYHQRAREVSRSGIETPSDRPHNSSALADVSLSQQREAGDALAAVAQHIRQTGKVVFTRGNVDVGRVSAQESLRLAMLSNSRLARQYYPRHEFLTDAEAYAQVKKVYGDRAPSRQYEASDIVLVSNIVAGLPKLADGSIDWAAAVRAVTPYANVARQAGADEIEHRARRRAQGNVTMEAARVAVRRESPALATMVDGGPGTAQALRELLAK